MIYIANDKLPFCERLLFVKIRTAASNSNNKFHVNKLTNDIYYAHITSLVMSCNIVC